MPWMIVVLLLTMLDKLSSEVACIRLADIYWNVTNPIFRIDNTDHIIDVNKGNVPFEYDQVNIICPVYPHQNTGTDIIDTTEEENETYIIYNVSKDEYDSCRITNPHPKIIAICDKPHQVMYFTITFRSFTPQPGGLEFLPGHDYYFVSTSTGRPEGLHQKVGGRCATHNMKVIFKVCCSPDKSTTSSPLGPLSHRPVVHKALTEIATPETDQSLPTQPTINGHNNKPYHHYNGKLTFPPRHQPHPVSSTTASFMAYTTPRYMRRPRPYPARITTPSSTKFQRPYDEVPIEDEMAKPPDGTRDHMPNKARSKNEDVINGRSSSSDGTCWTLSSRTSIHHWITLTLVFQLLLSLLWR